MLVHYVATRHANPEHRLRAGVIPRIMGIVIRGALPGEHAAEHIRDASNTACVISRHGMIWPYNGEFQVLG